MASSDRTSSSAFNVFDPRSTSAQSGLDFSNPSTLKECSRVAVLQAAGLESCENLPAELDLPGHFVDLLKAKCSSADFLVDSSGASNEKQDKRIYEGTDLINDNRVVLKVAEASSLEGDKGAELQKWKQLCLKGVQRCLVSFSENNAMVHVLEHTPVSLRDIIMKSKGLSLESTEAVIWLIANQLAKVLEKISSEGLRYNELKPGMIHVEGGTDGIILDNELLHFDCADNMMQQLTIHDNETAGIYTAPEIINGDGATPASVAWQIGCVMYEMATGCPAYQITDAANVFAAMNDVMQGNLSQLLQDGYSEQLRSTIMACLRPDSNERQSLDALQQMCSAKAGNVKDAAVAALKSILGT